MGICSVSRPAVFLDRDGVLVEEVYYPPPANGKRRCGRKTCVLSPRLPTEHDGLVMPVTRLC